MPFACAVVHGWLRSFVKLKRTTARREVPIASLRLARRRPERILSPPGET